MKKRWLLALLVIAGTAVFISTSKVGGGNAKNLNQPVAEADDLPPEMPIEAVQAEGRAEAAAQIAQGPADFLEAAKEYQKAIELAPGSAHLYYNLGLVYEHGKEYADAIRNFRLYLEKNPEAGDALDVEKKIAGLEYKLEKGEPVPVEPPPVVQYESTPPPPAPVSLSGFWTANQKTVSKWGETPLGPFEANVTEGSGRLDIFVKEGGATYDFSANKSGNQLTGTLTTRGNFGTFDNPFQGEISSDGNRIVLRSDYTWYLVGKEDRWVQNYTDKETWEFTR
jgi:tetratricopeptide (TPR) repeat protein